MSKIFVSGLQVQEMLSRNCDELVKWQDRAASLQQELDQARKCIEALNICIKQDDERAASLEARVKRLETECDASLRTIAEERERSERLSEAGAQLLKVIDAAPLLNLSNGVQLGQTSWLVKATDACDALRAALKDIPDA